MQAPGGARVVQAHSEALPRGVRPLVGRARSKLMQLKRKLACTLRELGSVRSAGDLQRIFTLDQLVAWGVLLCCMVSVTLWIYFVPDLMAASLSSTSELAAPLTPTKTPTTSSSVDFQGGFSRRVGPGSLGAAKGKRGGGVKVGASVGSGGSGAKEASLTKGRGVGTTISTTPRLAPSAARAATDRVRASSLSQAGGRIQGVGRASTAAAQRVARATSRSSTPSSTRQSSGHGKHRRL